MTLRQTRLIHLVFLFALLAFALCSQPSGLKLAPSQTVAAYGQFPLSFTLEGQRATARAAGYSLALDGDSAVLSLQSAAEVRLQLVNAQPADCALPLDPLPGRVNYFIGNDPQAWRANLPTFARVKYTSVYPGVDAIPFK